MHGRDVIYQGEALAFVNIERQAHALRAKAPAGVVQTLCPTPPISVKATAEAGGKLPVGCPAWHDRAWWSR